MAKTSETDDRLGRGVSLSDRKDNLLNYKRYLDQQVLSFIEETQSFYPKDLEADDWIKQRSVYNRMAAHFRSPRPYGLAVSDERFSAVPVRRYGPATETVILYAHGGGFVLGGLDSHDDVCAEIAAKTEYQVIAVDYRLAPEHRHPAAYDDVLKVAETLAQHHALVLCGDSAGATLCASIAGTWTTPALKGQVLIYPSLGFAPKGGSFETHANAPLLSRDELLGYSDIRGGAADDPTATPKAGDFKHLPPTRLFPAECDPLHDDALRYRDTALSHGVDVTLETGTGLVHGWLRARHKSERAKAQFERIIAAISERCRAETAQKPHR